MPAPEEVFVEEPGELSAREYAANNIVYLIDVSSSMKYPHKLPFLKTSMTNLLYLLRSIDKLAIVTYASEVKVLLKSTPASE